MHNFFVWLTVVMLCVQSSAATVSNNNGAGGSLAITGKVVIDSPVVVVYGASYGSDPGSKDFSVQIGDTAGANDRIWLSSVSTLFPDQVINDPTSRGNTFMFPIARYQLCVDVNSPAGAYIKVRANRLIEEAPGTHFVPLYVEVIANGAASSGKQNFLFTSDEASDIGNLNKTIHRLKDSVFNQNVGSINHSQPMAVNNWSNSGHNEVSYGDDRFIKGNGNLFAIDHFSVNDASSAGYDLERNQTLSADPNNYKYDSTVFKDEYACPISSRIEVYLYADLAALLVAPGAIYSGSVNIDFATTNS